APDTCAPRARSRSAGDTSNAAAVVIRALETFAVAAVVACAGPPGVETRGPAARSTGTSHRIDLVRDRMATAFPPFLLSRPPPRGIGPADGPETVRQRRRGPVLLPETGPGIASGMGGDRRAFVPVRAHRRGDRGPGRGPTGVGGEPGLHRPESPSRAGRGPRS